MYRDRQVCRYMLRRLGKSSGNAFVPRAAAFSAASKPKMPDLDEESLFNRLAEDKWSGRIRLFTRAAITGTLIYAVGFMDYSPFIGDTEHIFSPIQRWVKKQQRALWTLDRDVPEYTEKP